MRGRRTRCSRDGPYPHFDIERLWSFILDSLGALNREQRIDAISVTTHGVAAALLDADGNLVLPVLDYEHDGPEQLAADYDARAPALRRNRHAAAADRAQPWRAAVLAGAGISRGIRAASRAS